MRHDDFCEAERERQRMLRMTLRSEAEVAELWLHCNCATRAYHSDANARRSSRMVVIDLRPAPSRSA